jgi:hypothetical protein
VRYLQERKEEKKMSDEANNISEALLFECEAQN